jgi:hypothetical protein
MLSIRKRINDRICCFDWVIHKLQIELCPKEVLFDEADRYMHQIDEAIAKEYAV